MAEKKLYGDRAQWEIISYSELTPEATILINVTGNDFGNIKAFYMKDFKGEKGDQGVPGSVMLPDGLEITSAGYSFLSCVSYQTQRSLINSRTEGDNEATVFLKRGDIIRPNVNKQDVVCGGDARLMPISGIIMWDGIPNANGTIPGCPGFYLCDGRNNTPDLRDKFVIGVSGIHGLGSTGGSKDAIVVNHGHTVTTTVTDPGHSHPNSKLYSADGGAAGSFGGNDGPIYTNSNTNTTGISVNVAVQLTGESGVNANLPPYYALCFIKFFGY
jgi:hypothetical protein